MKPKNISARAYFASCLFLIFASVTGSAPAFGAKKPETPHLTFVNEYIRELAAVEDIREQGERQLKQDAKDEMSPFLNAVHTCTLLQLELRARINLLKDMHLDAPFDTLIPTIIKFYEHKIDLYQQIIDIGSAFIAGPKPGVDYGELASEMPKVRAKLDYIDHALFDVTPLVFATLIDPKPDSKNHASHLIITKTERTKLLDDVTDAFGSKLDEKGDKNYTVGAASVLKKMLLGGHKCSDEPWE